MQKPNTESNDNPSSQSHNARNNGYMQEPPNGDPTPEQIREMCREIRKGWSEKEYWVRSGHAGGKPVLTVPRVRDRGRVAAT